MIGRAVALVYGLASYLIFSLSFAYTPAFLGNFLVPKTIDVGADSPPAHAVVIDAILLGLFAIQHSVMARPASSAGGRASFRLPASAAPMC